MFTVPTDNLREKIRLINRVVVVDLSVPSFLCNHLRILGVLVSYCNTRVNPLMILIGQNIHLSRPFLQELAFLLHVLRDLVLGLYGLYEALESVVLVDVQVVLFLC